MIPRLPVTRALAALIETATGLPVGLGRLPPNAPEPPYYLLYSVDGAFSGAPYADRHEDRTLVYQVTCVSGPDDDRPGSHGTEDQAEWMADKVHQAVLGRDPATGRWRHDLNLPAGIRCTGRRPDTEPGGTSDPGDAIMSYVLRFRLDLTAA